MKLTALATVPNLRLAWRRITTGGNYQYKRLYRSLYLSSEIALDANLKDLRQRLLGGTFTPRHPERIYVPKTSGLHRPIALLGIEDQIVLQAFANLAARKLQHRRARLQFKSVFSNILEKPDSIFFFRRWQQTYATFQARIQSYHDKGMHWVGDFDLAAFYDTVSHELLLKTLYPQTAGDDLNWIRDCLRTWSSDQAVSCHGHGLPQGPLASDFLAEVFLLPIDLVLHRRRGYLRYVDDVRLLGKTEDDVRAGLIDLERLCRERGLIPQAGKFAIKHAQSAQAAMGMLPSISDPQHESTGELLGRLRAKTIFMSAIGGKPYRVTDKTRMRYVLYRAGPDGHLLRLVLRLIPRHPEHADTFFVYLARFGYRRSIERHCLELVRRSPYPYVRGEAWHVLALCLRERRSATAMQERSLSSRAIAIAKLRTGENFTERWGACHFLCVIGMQRASHHSRFLKYQSPLLQSLLADVLPNDAFNPGEAVHAYLARHEPEPGLSVCSKMHQRGLQLGALGMSVASVPTQVANTLRELGLLAHPAAKIDPIAELLSGRYGVARTASWRGLLAAEYVHALGLLKQAEAAFDGGRSFWLACQNSFNQAVFLALQRHLHAIGHAGACKVTDPKGHLLNFGVTLENTAPFSTHCPRIGRCFRLMNERRNQLPVSHPYEKRTALQTRYLRKQERNGFVALLRNAYSDVVALIP